MKTWILVANRAEARIFTYDSKKKSTVEFLRKMENPRGRLRDQDINADKPGIFAGVGSYASGLEKGQSPTERVAEEFSKEIIAELESGKAQNSFEGLIIFAEASFLGLIRNAMSKDLAKYVVQTVAKDLGAVTTPEVQERISSVQIQ